MSGCFDLLVTPLGLCNAVATFQGYMDELLKEMKRRKVAVYVHDLIIVPYRSKSPQLILNYKISLEQKINSNVNVLDKKYAN